jgi:4-hydroxythreonine-4-phosphate dehydrogenase
VTDELVIATGDPQGVGPEVSVAAARAVVASKRDVALVLVGDREVLVRAGADRTWSEAASTTDRGGISIFPAPLPAPLSAKPPSDAGGKGALAALDAALARVRSNPRRALVTAPISKEAARISSPEFDGHTGYLGQRLGVASPVMMFVAPTFRVALATVHVPLGKVPALVTPERLRGVVEVTRFELNRRFRVRQPRIHVLGLNPHAGEAGGIGDEEVRSLGPTIRDLASLGLLISGPYPADSYFRPGFEKNADAIIAMYHDQGLLPVKCLAFGDSVNVTLGLPIVRTSVDHGTAFDLAGKGVADARSMECAMRLALDILSATPADRLTEIPEVARSRW